MPPEFSSAAPLTSSGSRHGRRPLPAGLVRWYGPLATAFFLFALGLFASAMYSMLGSIHEARQVRAVPVMRLISHDRTANIELGGRRYAILGLRQGTRGRPDAVFIRDVASGRVKTFRPGASLFHGPVVLTHAGDGRIDLRHKGRTHRILLK